MTKFDLFNSIGNVDDDLIDKAQQPKKCNKKAIITITSAAACAVVVCAAVLIVQNLNKNGNRDVHSGAVSAIDTSSVTPVHEELPAVRAGSEAPVPERSSGETGSEAIEIAYEQIPVDMYKIRDGKLVHSQLVLDADPQKIFTVWKSENDIGNEVQLVNVRLEDNGTEEVSEFSGVAVATHTVGDHTTLTITVTSNLENYYEIEDYYCFRSKELVLESLKKTMLSMCDPKPDDYQLILSDDTKTESKNNHEGEKADASTAAETGPESPRTEIAPEQGAASGACQEYTPDIPESFASGSNYAEEISESNRINPNDIQYNDLGEILE